MSNPVVLDFIVGADLSVVLDGEAMDDDVIAIAYAEEEVMLRSDPDFAAFLDDRRNDDIEHMELTCYDCEG